VFTWGEVLTKGGEEVQKHRGKRGKAGGDVGIMFMGNKGSDGLGGDLLLTLDEKEKKNKRGTGACVFGYCKSVMSCKY